MVSWSRERPIRSPCQATESCPSRYRQSPAVVNGLAELGGVVRRERVSGGRQGRVGEHLVVAVEAQQARHVDDRVVHLAALGVPGHVAPQRRVEQVGAADEAGHDVDPRAVREVSSAHLAQRVDDHVVIEVEQRPLESGHPVILDGIRTPVQRSPGDRAGRQPSLVIRSLGPGEIGPVPR